MRLWFSFSPKAMLQQGELQGETLQLQKSDNNSSLYQLLENLNQLVCEPEELKDFMVRLSTTYGANDKHPQ